MSIDPMRSLETMHRVGPEFAKAKAERVYIEESLRSVSWMHMPPMRTRRL